MTKQFGLKFFNSFAPFRVFPVTVDNFDLLNLALKIYSIALCRTGCNISIKIPFWGVKMAKYAFWLKNCHCGLLSESLMSGEKMLTFQTWLIKSLILPSWGQGCKIIIIDDFGHFLYIFLYKIAGHHKGRYLAPFLKCQYQYFCSLDPRGTPGDN